jgi:hypothetical protein
VICLIALASVVGTAALVTDGCQKLAPGPWGGEGLQLVIMADTQTIEFSCAHGTIDQPIEPDAEGRFDVTGTYTQERPGPEREGQPAKAEPARYTGRIQGETMTLAITLGESKKPVGTYTLTKGKTVRIFKCK